MRYAQWFFFALGLFNGGIAIGAITAWAVGTAAPTFTWATLALLHSLACAVLLRRP